MRIVLAGSGIFGIPSFERISEKFDVIGVITQIDKPKGRGYKLSPTPVAIWAEHKGINVWKLSSIKDFSPLGDLMVIIDCGFIIPRNIIESYPLGVIALHPSLLPKYRGPEPIRRALLAGEKETGLTTFFVNERVDAGDIILQKRIIIGEKTYYGELFRKLAEEGANLVEETITLIGLGKAPRTPQSEEEATYAPKFSKEERIINWSLSAEYIDKLVRALSPEPGAITNFRGKLLKILEVEFIKEHYKCYPGEVLSVSREGILVCTGENSLLIKRLQLEGKREMSAIEFCCGYNPLRGEILGK
ncbi:MAG: methionyl-tRNA formyltransferase [Synergistetes bacterium]|nr:methionyl-tRNA formyltransferase [Synergistota bacterium]MCX8128230.1 methionyl-tRNA formyltransferase [Synergistota bacterium]MDW8192677.1 methionyl-tRNA formyltransferase [Synergistota bacterium]